MSSGRRFDCSGRRALVRYGSVCDRVPEPEFFMPLPEPSSARRRLHTRRIEMEGFLREDGCFDLEAVLVDLKDSDYRILSGVRAAGDALHAMRLRFTIDQKFNVLAVEAVSEAVPYAGHCDTIGPAYGSLVGLNLFNGFRKAALA